MTVNLYPAVWFCIFRYRPRGFGPSPQWYDAIISYSLCHQFSS